MATDVLSISCEDCGVHAGHMCAQPEMMPGLEPGPNDTFWQWVHLSRVEAARRAGFLAPEHPSQRTQDLAEWPMV